MVVLLAGIDGQLVDDDDVGRIMDMSFVVPQDKLTLKVEDSQYLSRGLWSERSTVRFGQARKLVCWGTMPLIPKVVPIEGF